MVRSEINAEWRQFCRLNKRLNRIIILFDINVYKIVLSLYAKAAIFCKQHDKYNKITTAIKTDVTISLLTKLSP